ncbi:hypothetical protein GCM10022215_36000 [Nocardioides fonticola]|uniref:Uncharacterized protein n=1 Tax=Nocardioides fonticola TaxID=450363 RepID=A0ABP7XV41_9ACTN
MLNLTRGWGPIVLPLVSFLQVIAGEQSALSSDEFWSDVAVGVAAWLTAEVVHSTCANRDPESQQLNCLEQPQWTWEAWRDV